MLVGGFRSRPGLGAKARRISFGLVLLSCAIAGTGTAMLYSAAHGSWEPWASAHAARFGVGLVVLLAVALADIRTWWRHAYLIYGACLALLAVVELVGSASMGARRWIDLDVVRLQPSELMKIGLVLALARYFNGLEVDEARRIPALLPPLLLIACPAALVLAQPDLGTAAAIVLIGGAVLFVAGARLWFFGAALASCAAAVPVVWGLLKPYQQSRVLTFLDPERDPLGAGYHIIQSKIALGSGGLTGEGFLRGTQSHLNFLPERQTDFIFAMLAEEFGLLGSLGLLVLCGLVLAYGTVIGLQSRSHFGRLVALGITAMLFLYVFVNVAMVTGLLPVVGMPLPLVSYGGTAMLATMAGIGLVAGVYVHKDLPVMSASRRV